MFSGHSVSQPSFLILFFVYARNPGAGGAESPYQLRFNRSHDWSKLRRLGSACYHFSGKHEKFASRGGLGVVLGDSRLQSYNVRTFEYYVETKREARIVHTRDALAISRAGHGQT